MMKKMIENITIEKYKCFENLKLENLSRINIISGKNNVGKTALLEILYIINAGHYRLSLSTIAKNRNIEKKYFQKYIKDTEFFVIVDNSKYNFKVKNKKDLNEEEIKEKNKFNADYDEYICLFVNDDLHLFPLDTVKKEGNTEYQYINSSKPSNETLIKLYSKVQTLNLQQKFLEYLQILDSNIKWLEPYFFNDELVLRVTLENPEISLITSELGEGVNRYIEILASMLSIEAPYTVFKKTIFIDEIENGLHYSKLVEIAKTIIEISQEKDIQVFISTHDKDIIEAFAQASEEMEFKDISSIELYKDEKNIIHPIVMDYDNFIYGIEVGEDFR